MVRGRRVSMHVLFQVAFGSGVVSSVPGRTGCPLLRTSLYLWGEFVASFRSWWAGSTPSTTEVYLEVRNKCGRGAIKKVLRGGVAGCIPAHLLDGRNDHAERDGQRRLGRCGWSVRARHRPIQRLVFERSGPEHRIPGIKGPRCPGGEGNSRHASGFMPGMPEDRGPAGTTTPP